jgi:NADH-quinone oxidoreductase subunit N
MTLDNFLIMRHELLLSAAALIILTAEIFWHPERKRSIMLFSIILFAVVTIAGFLPSQSGTLFGGMYVTDGTRLLMKNIINLGALIIFFQSAG